MKIVQIIKVVILIVVFTLTSCNADNSIDTGIDGVPELSDTAKTIIINLKNKTDNFTETPSTDDLNRGFNFDYCFNFVFPITLSYNNSTEIVVSDSTQLLSVIQTMTDTQYINGIAFPFNVTTSNGQETILNEQEFASVINNCDLDGDGTPNYQDTDDDGDGVNDIDEDTNNDGNATNDDTDGDNTPDYQDTDDDGDGINTANEDTNNDGDATNDDTDGDNTPDYQDTDDDGDGVNTADEDNDHDGDVANDDSDGDNTPDYLDTDSDNDGIDDGNDSDADGDGVDDDNEGDDDGGK